MIYLVAMIFVMASAFAVVSNPDIFSPAKIILFFFLIFHFGAVLEPTTTVTGALILLVLFMAVIVVALETRRFTPHRPIAPAAVVADARIDFAALLWVVSIPGIFAQIYMIQHFGGLDGYSRSIGLRVVEWSGFGWARVLILLLTPINMAYFAIGLQQRRSRLWWTVYGGHLSILLLIALLSGSRSSLLNVFVIQLIIFHYVRARISPYRALLSAGTLIFAALFLSVVRKTARVTDGQFTFQANRSGRLIEFDSFYYGVQPLELLTHTEHLTLAHGSTFLSILTNNIPRAWWPDKPDTGGVFFTRFYAGDAWFGFSNLTPTFLGEWIINFGWIFGITGFFVVYGAILVMISRYYRRMQDATFGQTIDVVRAVDVVIYAHVLLAATALIVGEATSVILSLITSQMLPLFAIRWYVARRSRA